MSTTADSIEQPDEDELDLGAIFKRLYVGRWWIAASTLLFAIGFGVIAFMSEPVYRASAVLVPASDGKGGLAGGLSSALGQFGGLASLAGINLGGSGTDVEEALAVLRSRQFTEAFIDDFTLRDELLAAASSPLRSWLNLPPEDPHSAKAFKYFDKHVRFVSQDKKTGLVTVRMDWTDRDKAAAWTNALVARLNKEMRARAIDNANASVGFLEKEMAGTNVVDTRQAISRLIESQIKQRMLANVTQEYAFRVVDRAMAADEDDPVRPRKAVLILIGALLGAALGAGATALFTARRKPEGVDASV